MTGIYVNDEGNWKLPKSVWVNQLGTWRVCKNVYVNKSGAWKELIKTVDITSNQSNFNLYHHLGSPEQAISVIVNIGFDVTISSDGPTLPQWCPYYCTTTRVNLPKRPTAFTVGNFPSGSTIIINNNGYISGGGGYGGAGGASPAKGPSYNSQVSGTAGGAGGDGIVKGSSNNYDCTIVNTGTIASGGGGGGGACARYFTSSNIYWTTSGWTQGGQGGDGGGITGYSRTQGGPSSANKGIDSNGVDGGNGGNIGEDGFAGQAGQSYGAVNGVGGQAGKAVGSDIELAVSGTIIGTIG